ncbi:hypothetical protein KUTeg_018070, partial [Tegillarca granosa]
MQLRTKVQCLSQIANGMGYLHAKGVVLKHLKGYATLPRGKICYMAPEILSVLKVVPPNIVIDSSYDRESDVYAF